MKPQKWVGPDAVEHAGHDKEFGFTSVAMGSHWMVGNRRGT